jgi:hypothetical protein
VDTNYFNGAFFMFKLPVARLLICVCLFFFISISVYAGPSVRSFRCGNRIVKIGDKKHDVMTICGEPTSKEVTGTDEEGYYSEREEESPFPDENYKDGSYGSVTVKIEEWYYNCGSHNFSYILSFKGNILNEIKQTGYGEGKSECDGPSVSKGALPDTSEAQAMDERACDKTLKPISELAKKTGIPVDILMREAVNYLFKKYSGD